MTARLGVNSLVWGAHRQRGGTKTGTVECMFGCSAGVRDNDCSIVPPARGRREQPRIIPI